MLALLLLMLFSAPATCLFAGENPAGAQKPSPEMAVSSGRPADELGPWIWAEQTLDQQTCKLWRAFEIPQAGSVAKARIVMTVDNEFTLYLDGRELGRGAEWRELFIFDLTSLLTPGRHVLAVKCFNSAEDAGMLFGLRIELTDGRLIEVKSDQSWRVVPEGISRWEKRTEAQPGWPAATIKAPLGAKSKTADVDWMPVPGKVIVMPTLLPIRLFFWQTGWFQVSLLSLCGVVILISLRLTAQLALQCNEQRLLQKERARIAREIHDDIGARMTQLVLDGEEAQSELTNDAASIESRLNHICEEARGLLATMDEILWAVNPQRDTLRDFAAYVCKYAQKFLKPTPIQCLLDVEPAISAAAFSLPLRRSLFMAIKEALNNAVKYSAATELRLQIQWQNERLVVVVADNGKGFDPAKVTPDRNGLTNMAQRLREIGGRCEVASRPGQGCHVEFSIPLNRRRPWAWIWNAGQFAGHMNESRNDGTSQHSEKHDPTKF